MTNVKVSYEVLEQAFNESQAERDRLWDEQMEALELFQYVLDQYDNEGEITFDTIERIKDFMKEGI